MRSMLSVPKPATAMICAALAVAVAVTVTAAPAKADAIQTGSCSLTGSSLPAIDTLIYEKSSGGDPIARLTGAKIGLVASDFFAGASDRVHVKTSVGAGSFRIEGWIDAKRLPVFTNKNVPVVQSHIWIGALREVTVIGAGSGKPRVKRQVGLPFNQAFTGWADCSALSLAATAPSGWTPTGNARAYVAKKDVELYDSGDDGRNLITLLSPDSKGNGIVLWSTEKKGGWVRLVHQSEVVIDAWARTKDLKELPRGELQDSHPPSTSRRSPPALKLSGKANSATAPKDIESGASASDMGKLIGTLEAGAEVYVLDIVAGWASVLPKVLNVAPHGEGQFWVKASTLGVLP